MGGLWDNLPLIVCVAVATRNVVALGLCPFWVVCR